MANSGNVFSSFDPHPGERRRSARHTFTATADIMDPRSHLQISARTSDLDYRGCYVDTLNPFVGGTNIVLRIAKDNQSFSTMATVVYAHAGMGMGVVFDTLSHDQLRILERWLEKPAASVHLTAHTPHVGHIPPVQHSQHSQHVPVSVAAPAPKHEVTPVAHAATPAAPAEKENTEVLKYLVLMLVKKGVLVEFEGQALLERLLG